jgi:cell volume regulation protein A
MLSIEWPMLVIAALLLVSVAASRASFRLGVPALLLFIGIGMLAGSEGPGGIHFDDAGIAQAFGSVALMVILFSGGLDSDWTAFRPVVWRGLALANVGVSLSALLVGAFATLALGFAPLEGLLLGAIISSTDAAAVFSVMRTREVNLHEGLEALIELESGSNDPIAIFLTIGLTGILQAPDRALWQLIPAFVLQMSIGAVAGLAMGRLAGITINRVRLNLEGLYPALALGIMLLTFSGTALLGGNGFLAVYVAGIVIGNTDIVHKRSLLRFCDGLAWLMQIAMFLMLGLLVFPSQLAPVASDGLLVALFLMFVARPISVLIALARSRFSPAAQLMVAWAGLRGAVPIILATFPLLAGIPSAGTIFNLVFFIVLASVLVQGTSIAAVAQWLGVNRPGGGEMRFPQEFVPQVGLASRLAEVTVAPHAPAVGRALVELGLPRGALVVLITRNGDGLVPGGSTVFAAGDRVLFLLDAGALEIVRRTFSAAPAGPPE